MIRAMTDGELVGSRVPSPLDNPHVVIEDDTFALASKRDWAPLREEGFKPNAAITILSNRQPQFR